MTRFPASWEGGGLHPKILFTQVFKSPCEFLCQTTAKRGGKVGSFRIFVGKLDLGIPLAFSTFFLRIFQVDELLVKIYILICTSREMEN